MFVKTPQRWGRILIISNGFFHCYAFWERNVNFFFFFAFFFRTGQESELTPVYMCVCFSRVTINRQVWRRCRKSIFYPTTTRFAAAFAAVSGFFFRLSSFCCTLSCSTFLGVYRREFFIYFFFFKAWFFTPVNLDCNRKIYNIYILL